MLVRFFDVAEVAQPGRRCREYPRNARWVGVPGRHKRHPYPFNMSLSNRHDCPATCFFPHTVLARFANMYTVGSGLYSILCDSITQQGLNCSVCSPHSTSSCIEPTTELSDSLSHFRIGRSKHVKYVSK